VLPKQRYVRSQLVDAYEIVAGVHRFRAMFQILNWEVIPVQIIHAGSLEAELYHD
jgi:ParB-like chromosome segregation protein Spo0J